MRLDYLKFSDKEYYLDLISCMGNVDRSEEMWRNFFQIYEESDVREIYLAYIDSKDKTQKVIGTVTTIVEPKIYLPGPVVHIEDVVVDPKYRMLGLGKLIIKEVEKIAKSYHNASILTVSIGNDKLLEFFSKCFYKDDEFIDSAYGFILSKWMD
jgi:GNAT superfamily N-acetyltransferase